MSLKKVAQSVTIQYIGRVFGYLCSLGTVAIITRQLGVSNYGEYTTIFAIASLVITMSDFGFFWSTIHNVVDAKDKGKVISEISGIKFAATLGLLIIAAAIVYLGSFSPAVKGAYWVLAIFVLASSVNNVFVAVYQSEYRMIRPTVSEALARLVNLVLAYWGSVSGFGVFYYVAIATFASCLTIGINWYGLRSFIGEIRIKVLGYKWSSYYKTIFMLGLVQIFYMTFYRIDVAILSWFKPSVDVGIYGIVVKVTEIISAVASIFVGALFPTLVESFKNNSKEYLSYVGRSVLIMFALALPIAILGQWFTEDLVNVVGGTSFTTTGTVVFGGVTIYAQTILSLALIFCALNYLSVIFYTALLAASEMRVLLLFNTLALTINFSLNVIFVPYFSYFATTVVTVITELFILLFTMIFFLVKFKSLPYLKELLGVCVAVVPAAAFLTYYSPESFIWRFVATSLIYFVALALLVPSSRKKLSSLFKFD